MIFGIGGEVPEEVRRQMEEAAEAQRLSSESAIRELNEWMEALDEDSLKHVRGLIRGTVNDPGYGQFINGWLSHLLSDKFKVCIYCGEKHTTPDEWLAAHSGGAPA